MGISTMRGKGIMTVVVVLVLMLTATAGATTDVGTPDNPVRFSAAGYPNAPNDLADALQEATGLVFEFETVDGGAPAVEWMCVDHPDTSMRLMSSSVYVFAERICRADARLHLFRFGSDGYSSGFFVPVDSEFDTLDDLIGAVNLEWYYATLDSTSSYQVPKGMLAMAGIDYSAAFELGDHRAVVRQVHDLVGSGDPVFGTAYYDVRTAVADEPGYEDVFDKVRLLAQSPAIPNSPIAFGPDFPANLRRQIEKALVEFADPEGPDYGIWEESMFEDSSLDKLKKKEFRFLSSVLEAAGIVLEDL